MYFQRLVRYLKANKDSVIVTVVPVLVYLNALKCGFVSDDKVLIQNNPYLLGKLVLRYWFTRPYMSTDTQATTNYFRPLPGLSFSLDGWLWKMAPAGFHLTNVIIFAATALLLYLLVRKLFANKPIAMITALLFAVHPVHTEAVVWVSGRPDLLCGFFALLAMLLFAKWKETAKTGYKLGSAAAFAGALLSKEVSILVIPFLFVITYLDEPAAKRKRIVARIMAIVPHLAVLAVYLGARQAMLIASSDLYVSATYTPAPLMHRLLGVPVNLLRYLDMLFVPRSSELYYSATIISSVINPKFIVCASFLFVLIVLVVWKRSNTIVFWPVVWFFATLIPATNIVQLPGQTMGERYVYIPSMGICIVVAAGLVWLWSVMKRKSGQIATIVGVCLIVLLTGFLARTTWAGNSRWLDDFTIWQYVVSRHPDVPYAHCGLGVEYLAKGLDQEAIEEFHIALKLRPDYAAAHLNLGNALADQGEYKEARKQFLASIEDDPKVTQAYIQLAQLYKTIDPPKTDDAITILERGLTAVPGNSLIAYNLADLCVESDRNLPRAAGLLEKIIKDTPDTDLPRMSLGKAYVLMGKKTEAKKQFRWLIEHSPGLQSDAQTALDNLD
ncbi:MAG: tetratricopeptide repeat protein [Armatimonadota bacterium]